MEARLSLGKPCEVAEYIGKPERTLTQWRYLGIGPRFIKVGRDVRYRWADVDRWIEEHAVGGAA